MNQRFHGERLTVFLLGIGVGVVDASFILDLKVLNSDNVSLDLRFQQCDICKFRNLGSN